VRSEHEELPEGVYWGFSRPHDLGRLQALLSLLSCGLGVVSSHTETAFSLLRALWRFPARNRIIAGLCSATVVVEARERSGALITADFALEEGREVMAVPGEITSALSAGANALLRLGATPVTSPNDVLEAIGLERARSREQPPPGGTPAQLLALLREAPSSVDELVHRSGLAAGAVAVALTELELAGHVSAGDGVYRSSSSHGTLT
jgi:DNA processing protein